MYVFVCVCVAHFRAESNRTIKNPPKEFDCPIDLQPINVYLLNLYKSFISHRHTCVYIDLPWCCSSINHFRKNIAEGDKSNRRFRTGRPNPHEILPKRLSFRNENRSQIRLSSRSSDLFIFKMLCWWHISRMNQPACFLVIKMFISFSVVHSPMFRFRKPNALDSFSIILYISGRFSPSVARWLRFQYNFLFFMIFKGMLVFILNSSQFSHVFISYVYCLRFYRILFDICSPIG